MFELILFSPALPTPLFFMSLNKVHTHQGIVGFWRKSEDKFWLQKSGESREIIPKIS